MKKNPEQKKRTGIYVAVFFISLILYVTGVLSGLYANKVFIKEADKNIDALKVSTNQEIQTLKESTGNEIESMQSYVNFLNENIKSMQLEQTFMNTLNPKERCAYIKLSQQQLVDQLDYYWKRLPFRIEEYEQYYQLSKEDLLLKQQYTDLALRTWILSKDQHDMCDTQITSALYFYTQDCNECLIQSQMLDNLKVLMQNQNKTLLIFAIDLNSNNAMISTLTRFYNITNAPALIIEDYAFTNPTYNEKQIMKLLGYN